METAAQAMSYIQYIQVFGPLIIALLGIAVVWGIMKTKIEGNEKDIKVLSEKCDDQQKEISSVSSRVAVNEKSTSNVEIIMAEMRDDIKKLLRQGGA